MDFFGKYQSPFGYENGENGGVDSYGVDHSGFSTQDELQYQTLRTNRENELANDMQRQGIAEENYPQYGVNFWGNNANNNYGFGTSNISQNLQNVTNQLSNSGLNNVLTNNQVFANSDYIINTKSRINKPSSYFQNNNHTDIQPQNWESAAEGKQVYDNVVRYEGNFTSPDQSVFNYAKSAIQGGLDLVSNFSNMRKMNVTDKYKHAMMNCNAAQYGQGGADIATLASNLREWNDKRTGSNTIDNSEADQYANKIGRLLGGKYPNGDCDELIQKYIKKNW